MHHSHYRNQQIYFHLHPIEMIPVNVLQKMDKAQNNELDCLPPEGITFFASENNFLELFNISINELGNY